MSGARIHRALADSGLSFVPSPDTTLLLHSLLDLYERRGGEPRRAVRVRLDEIAADLPGYYSQVDPQPRLVANEQLLELESRGWVHLAWVPGQQGHLLEAVDLEPGAVTSLYALLGREPLRERQERLRALLLGNRSGLDGWQLQAVQDVLNRLQAGKSPAPFRPADEEWNEDLLAILAALPVEGQVPYRVFSVRLFNDSKRFELLARAVAHLARRHQPEWQELNDAEVLREVGLVANPDHLYMYGPWELIDAEGQALSLAPFSPAVGIPADLAANTRRVRVTAGRVICVENLTSFYELVRHQGAGLAALCLWGNPAPPTRHLLRLLVQEPPLSVPLLLWADIDCGGLNILAQLRRTVSPAFTPWRMDVATLEAHARWAHPLSASEVRRLAQLRGHPALVDMVPLIEHMLRRGIKLEQEAIVLAGETL